MRLQLCTWPEVEAYLGRSTGLILPIGSTEQHGPNGLIGTDAICPEHIAHGVGERIDALVAPTLSIGVAQHHLGFPGSLTLRPSTLIAVLRDTIASMARHGFTHIYVFNGHGGNVATVQAAFAEIWGEASLSGGAGSRLRLKLSNWYLGRRVQALSNELFGEREGSHATPSEISLTWHAYPKRAQPMQLDPEVAPQGTIRDAVDYRHQFPDGRIGSAPSLATVEAGRRLYEGAIEDTIEDYQRFLAEG